MSKRMTAANWRRKVAAGQAIRDRVARLDDLESCLRHLAEADTDCGELAKAKAKAWAAEMSGEGIELLEKGDGMHPA